MGKSRLIAQVADQAHADGALVLAGMCDSELAVPYQPFAMALRRGRRLADEELAAADRGRARAARARCSPAAAPGRPDDQGPAARFELFEAVAALLERLADGAAAWCSCSRTSSGRPRPPSAAAPPPRRSTSTTPRC